jgi:Ca2+/Na+ antiporter
VGAAFGNVYPDWKVNLTAYDYEVMALWFQSSDAGMLEVLGANDQSVILVLGITIPIEDQKHRNRIHVGQTSLNPAIAYCLARLANPMPGDVVLDMCCGTGTIPIEGAAKFKNVFWIGSDGK